MISRPVFMFLMLVTGVTLALTGCSRSPRVSFYTLVPLAAREANTLKYTPSVAVAAITLPDLVDRPQLVVRGDGSLVQILEMHRWAEPLKSGISRLLAENLSRHLGAARVSVYPQNASQDADYRLFLDIQRFESDADGVWVDALWTLRTLRDGKPVSGRCQIREAVRDKGNEAVVLAYSRAIAALSKDIADSIRKIPE